MRDRRDPAGPAPTGPDVGALAEGVAAGSRAALARAITLVESRRADHRIAAASLLERLLPRTGQAVRIGLTGVPGVGKSTLVEAFGTMLTGAGHRLAVLAVDPSSRRTGGSILGDKTRMAKLAVDPNAFIRPSPAAGTLGGVASKTREALLLCEAAGFDVVVVETVGVGQSETVVADMVDVFVALMLPGAGDELQGIKKGLLELADLIAINKAEGENAARAGAAAAEYRAALRILFSRTGEAPPVLTLSGLAGIGIEAFWAAIRDIAARRRADGSLAARRAEQSVRWFRSLLDERMRQALVPPAQRAALRGLEQAVADGRTTAPAAVEEAVASLLGARGQNRGG
ncbi:methylmalonyl Co-A mutase-associated GTPase MeaB [Propylenella binzhouense]|uniref:Methylmalonyl Co-A mutase-associated GTPase MeaB n=1 Tax=Propylenella binzhouense TaxID=2555902 RepID=A0A964T3T8_9HYPH|nr:methylmalonyl Co-A mutase-associated GTPase MeaB [Propylenella binzhouense]MYZ47923.1 methylmalonyl Co-A mutase-associated GTPase MeaB [Propylenella binzhouense]